MRAVLEHESKDLSSFMTENLFSLMLLHHESHEYNSRICNAPLSLLLSTTIKVRL